MKIADGWRRLDVQISVALVIATLVVLALFIRDATGWRYSLMLVAWVGWALVPPAYFLFEWSRFEGDDGALARLKYNHELASKFWIAGVTVMSAVLASKALECN